MAARAELKRRRQELGFTQEAAAEAVGVAVSSYKCWEQGTRTPRVGLRPRLARLLGVSLAEVRRWFDGEEPASPEATEVPSWLGHLAALEQGASELWAYEPVNLHGLLQTRRYATAVQRDDTVHGEPTEAEVAGWVDHRLTRQAVLTRRPDPLRLSVVLDESVLLRVAGDGEIMAEQLAHLAELATWPTIDVRILHLVPGTFVAGFGGFTVLTSRGATEPYMACTLDWAGAHYLDRRHELDRHVRLFRHLQDVARSRSDSLDLIRTVAKERYTP